MYIEMNNEDGGFDVEWYISNTWLWPSPHGACDFYYKLTSEGIKRYKCSSST